MAHICSGLKGAIRLLVLAWLKVRGRLASGRLSSYQFTTDTRSSEAPGLVKWPPWAFDCPATIKTSPTPTRSMVVSLITTVLLNTRMNSRYQPPRSVTVPANRPFRGPPSAVSQPVELPWPARIASARISTRVADEGHIPVIGTGASFWLFR